MIKTDIVIVGSGPAGIFTALELVRNGSDKNIIIVEKGMPVEKRRCPKAKTKKCMNCKPYCHITTGFSGAGAFSDGKLSLSSEVGGDLPTLVGDDEVSETINYAETAHRRRKSVPSVPSLPPADVERTGWRKSAPLTTLPTSPAPLT